MQLLNKDGIVNYSDGTSEYIDCFHGRSGYFDARFFYTDRGEFCISNGSIYKYDRLTNVLIPTDEIRRVRRIIVDYIDLYSMK